MLKAILLDLDNTLVLFDETAFYLRFMERIIPLFQDRMDGNQFHDRLLPAIRQLRHNEGEISNEALFLNVFCQGIEDQRDDIWNRFMHFYQTEYEKIPVEVEKPRELETVIAQLSAWDLTLVVATNPIFPEIAPIKRMAWVDLHMENFSLLTHMENMSFAKPRKEYYQQICDMIGIAPQACMMVGNDAINDMVAGDIGMQTFLTTEAGPLDYRAVTKGRKVRVGETHPADFSGPLAELIPTVARINRY